MFQLTSVEVLSGVVVMFCSSVSVLTPNGNFWLVSLLHSLRDLCTSHRHLAGHASEAAVPFSSARGSGIVPRCYGGWASVPQVVLYSDEALLNRKNSYNICVWAEEKLQAIVEQDHKQKFCASNWCDICDFPVGRMYFLHSWQICKQGLSWEITAWIDGGCTIRLGPKYMVRAPRVYT